MHSVRSAFRAAPPAQLPGVHAKLAHSPRVVVRRHREAAEAAALLVTLVAAARAADDLREAVGVRPAPEGGGGPNYTNL